MPRYVALLRGINVGGRNKVAMADLRQVAASLGHIEVGTYIQSGNLVFTSPDASTTSLADALEQQIGRSLAVQPAVVVLSRRSIRYIDRAGAAPDRQASGSAGKHAAGGAAHLGA